MTGPAIGHTVSDDVICYCWLYRAELFIKCYINIIIKSTKYIKVRLPLFVDCGMEMRKFLKKGALYSMELFIEWNSKHFYWIELFLRWNFTLIKKFIFKMRLLLLIYVSVKWGLHVAIMLPWWYCLVTGVAMVILF